MPKLANPPLGCNEKIPYIILGNITVSLICASNGMDPPSFSNTLNERERRHVTFLYGGSTDNINLVAVDLAKLSFHVKAVNHVGRAIRDIKVSRDKLLSEVCNAPRGCTVAMEACGSAHYWARVFASHGYNIRLIAPQYVKPYVKSQKNDRADAEAIAEAASRASMRFVPVKSEEQQSIQAIHRIRTRLTKALVALMNEIRGVIAEFGYVVPQGRCALRKWLTDMPQGVPEMLRYSLSDLYKEMLELEGRVKLYSDKLKNIAQQIDVCRRLMTIPGIGPVVATALYAAVGKPQQFKNGRAMAAWLGLVPRQFSTGGKSSLGRISKRGDKYIRQLVIQGARAIVRVAARRADAYGLWVVKLKKEKGYNKAAVALANRNIRIAWSIMTNVDATFKADYKHLH